MKPMMIMLQNSRLQSPLQSPITPNDNQALPITLPITTRESIINQSFMVISHTISGALLYFSLPSRSVFVVFLFRSHPSLTRAISRSGAAYRVVVLSAGPPLLSGPGTATGNLYGINLKGGALDKFPGRKITSAVDQMIVVSVGRRRDPSPPAPTSDRDSIV